MRECPGCGFDRPDDDSICVSCGMPEIPPAQSENAMFDHLMRKPFDLPLKNGGNVRVKPLSLRDMGVVLAEEDAMRRMAIAVQRSLLGENGNTAFSADQVDYIMDEMDQRVLTEIGLWVMNGPEGAGDADPLSDSLAVTPTGAE